MRRGLLLLPLAAALALLAGCSGGDAELGPRLGKLEDENAQLRQTLTTLSEEVQPLADRIRDLDAQHRLLEKMLALAETDLRSRLREMVQDEAGAGGGRRGFARRNDEPPRLPQPYLGFSGQTNSPELAEKLKLAAKTGVVVTDVTKGAPADVGGLKMNDVVQQFGGKPIETKQQLGAAFSKLEIGGKCTLAVLREGKTLELEIEVGAR